MSETELELVGPLEAAFKNPEVIRENIKIFRLATKQILDPEVDIAIIHGKPFTKKSGWDATNAYFGVETKPTRSWRTELPEGEYAVTVAIQLSKLGHVVSRSGTCTSLEMKAKHNGKDFMGLYSACHGMAETRAVGRASSSFYMIPDVSAEEVEGAPTPMQKEGTRPQQKEGERPQFEPPIIICQCENDKVELTVDGKGCRTCRKILSEEKRLKIVKLRALNKAVSPP